MERLGKMGELCNRAVLLCFWRKTDAELRHPLAPVFNLFFVCPWLIVDLVISLLLSKITYEENKRRREKNAVSLQRSSP